MEKAQPAKVTPGPREERCVCGAVAPYGVGGLHYCKAHLPPQWFEIGARFEPVVLEDF